MDYCERLKKLSNDKLIDVVRNYKQYGYELDLRNFALTLLEERGIPVTDLELTGNLENENYKKAEALYLLFEKHTKKAFIAYIFLFLSIFLLQNQSYIAVIIWLILFATFMIFIIKAFINEHEFYKHTNQEYETGHILTYLILGIPLFGVMYFYFRDRMREKLKSYN